MNKSLQNSDVRVVTEFGAVGPCMANQNALRQIFLNLITNAVQAMPHGGELRSATRRCSTAASGSSSATPGIGIPPEHLKDIFNPFFTTKAPGQGTGLGLSVVHSVVQPLQRRDPRREPGRSSARRSPSSCRARVGRSRADAVSGLDRDAAGTRILLVEDEANMVRTCQDPRAQGLRRRCGGNGEEALDELAAGAYDVVITDLNMPVMDGMQLLRRLQGSRPAPGERRLLSPPTVVLTGHGTIQTAVEAMKLGAWRLSRSSPATPTSS